MVLFPFFNLSKKQFLFEKFLLFIFFLQEIDATFYLF